jgi:uncharacterized membrane protein YhaH (DUF805 family)
MPHNEHSSRQPKPPEHTMNSFLDAVRKYAEFSGRSGRREYWMFSMFFSLLVLALLIVDFMLGTYIVLTGLFVLALMIPSVAVLVRRLHDTNRSGWWLLVQLIPFVGAFVLLILLCIDSTPGDNQYGPPPKVA